MSECSLRQVVFRQARRLRAMDCRFAAVQTSARRPGRRRSHQEGGRERRHRTVGRKLLRDRSGPARRPHVRRRDLRHGRHADRLDAGGDAFLDGRGPSSTGSSPRTWLFHHGVPAAGVVAAVLPDHRYESALARINELELADVDEIAMMPGAREALDALVDAPRAIATSCTRPLAASRLALSGIVPPDVLITASPTSSAASRIPIPSWPPPAGWGSIRPAAWWSRTPRRASRRPGRPAVRRWRSRRPSRPPISDRPTW